MKSHEFYDKNHKFNHDSSVSLYKEEIVELMNVFQIENDTELDEKLESQEFYDLMQIYRHAPLGDQAGVVESFENVKKFIKNKLV